MLKKLRERERNRFLRPFDFFRRASIRKWGHVIPDVHKHYLLYERARNNPQSPFTYEPYVAEWLAEQEALLGVGTRVAAP